MSCVTEETNGSGHSRSTPAFQIFPVVNSKYAQAAWVDLDDAEEEARRIADILSHWGGAFEPWEREVPQRYVGEVLARLDVWSTPPASRCSVLLWIGHGVSNDDTASLIVRGTDDTDASILPAAFAEYLVAEHRHRERPDWAIVVVEACGGARFVELVGAELHFRRARDGVLLIGTGADRGRGHLGTFRRVLEQVRDAYSSNDTVITLSDLSGRIEELLDSPGVVRGSFRGCSPLVPRNTLTPTLTTPVDRYPDLRDVLQRLPDSDLRHLARTGTGADLLEISGYFAGRSDERAEIVSWFGSHDQGLLVLAGAPGSGKSALLGNVLLNAVPGLRQVLNRTPHPGTPWPEADSLPAIDGAILLTGAGIEYVITRIARIAGIAPPDDLLAHHRPEALLRLLRDRTNPVTLLADALDEARDPLEIAGLLSRLGSLPGVRIVVATRPTIGRAGSDLVGVLREAAPGVVVVPVTRDENAMFEFARASLATSAADLPTSDLRQAVEDIRERLRRDAVVYTWDFLHVRLLVRELLAAPRLLTREGAAERRELLGLDRAALFERAFARIVRILPQARPFLLALAHAEGRGLPRADRVWATVAEALDPGTRFTDAVVQRVLDIAGPYIMLDAEHGRSVFRLAHRTFTEQLLSAESTDAMRIPVLRALLRLASDAPELNPYLLHYLARHAAAAGRPGWDDLASYPDVLDRLDLRSLMSETWRVPPDDLSTSVKGVYRTGHLAASGGPEDRCGYRQLGTARTGGTLPPAHAENGVSRAAAWYVSSSRLALHPQHLTLAWPQGVPVHALTACAGPDGSAVLAAGDDRGRIRVWSPARLQPVELPVRGGGSSEILSLSAVLDEQGRVLLVSVSHGQPARVLRLHSNEPTRSLREPGCVLACRQVPPAQQADEQHKPAPDGAPLVAIGTSRGQLALWDVATGQQHGRRFVGHAGRITGLAMIGNDSRCLLASVGQDKSLRLWNVADSTPAASPVHWLAPWRSVAGVPSAGLVAAGDDRGWITYWRLDDLGHDRSVLCHDGPVDALAVLPAAGGRPELVVSGGADGAVRVWDPSAGTPVGPDLTGHADAVTCLAVLPAEDGVIRVASGSRDATIRIWSPDRGHAAAVPAAARITARSEPPRQWLLTGARGETVAVAVDDDGRVRCREGDGPDVVLETRGSKRPRCAITFTRRRTTLLATAGHDAVVRTWVVGSGASAGPALEGHEDWVNALAILAVPGPEPVLVSGDDDGLVAFWEPTTGVRRHQIRFGVPIRGLSVSDTVWQDLTISLDEGEVVIRLSERILTSAAGGALS